MTPKESRVVKISVRKEVYDRLREFAESKSLTMSDAIAVLLDNATVSSMIKELYATVSSKLDELHATVGSIVSSLEHATSGSITDAVHTTTGSMISKSEHATVGSMVSPSSHATAGSMVSQSVQPAPPRPTAPPTPPTMARVSDVRKSKKGRVVEWVPKSKIRNVDAYITAIEKERGPILYNELKKESGEWVCFAREDDVKKVVDELNAKGVPLDDVLKTGNYPEARDMYECGLIYLSSSEMKWKAI